MKTKLDAIHSNMIQRCTNPNHPFYSRYGGRGISVCPEWRNRKTFKEWALQNGYSENLTLDRVDNDRGYFPKIADGCQSKKTAITDARPIRLLRLTNAIP